MGWMAHQLVVQAQTGSAHDVAVVGKRQEVSRLSLHVCVPNLSGRTEQFQELTKLLKNCDFVSWRTVMPMELLQQECRA